jgi:tetratricopeptide (TPR) repeat protein
MPEVEKLAEKGKAQGLVVYCVNLGDEKAEIKSFLEEEKLRLSVLMAPEGFESKVAKAYGVDGIPTLAMIDRKGVLRSLTVGTRSASELAKDLEKIGIKISLPAEEAEAAAALQKARQTQEHRNRALKAYLLEKDEEAVAEMEAAANVNPEEPAPQIELGALRLRLKQPEEAEAAFARARAAEQEHEPDDITEIEIIVAETYLELGADPEAARRHAMQAVSLAAQKGDSLGQRDGRALAGRALLAQNKPDEAIAQLELAVKLDEMDPDNHYYLGQAYLKKGLKKEALGSYEKASDLAPLSFRCRKAYQQLKEELEKATQK